MYIQEKLKQFAKGQVSKMTHSEAQEFIETVIAPGEVMDVREVMLKYKGKTLEEALADYSFKTAIEEISNYADQK